MSMERHYVPYPFYWDDAPIDISYIFESEKPAGKHGFLQVKGDKFVFEDGTRGLFYGTNFNSALCFPEHDFARITAKRLAKFGLNMVRFHQMDADWCVPNIFYFSRGKKHDNTRSFDPESMDRFDYLVYCLKEQGIYMYLDNITYRRFRDGDGVKYAEDLAFAAKPYCMYDKRMIELQKEFITQLWNHVNPYTGLAYKDEPAIVMTEIINECCLFNAKAKVPYYVDMLNDMYRDWLKEKGLPVPENLNAQDMSPTSLDFIVELQKNYFDEMFDYIKKAGVRIPINGTNWQSSFGTMTSIANSDFADGHYYFYDFMLWKEFVKTNDNRSIMENRFNFGNISQTLEGKPFFMSEWDLPWPNEHRAECPIYMSALGGLQDWHGFAIHTYSYLAKPELLKMVGMESSSAAIAGSPYRQGLFNTFNDPAKFGLFYTAALMTRRGDVKPSKTIYALDATNPDLYNKGIPEFPDVSPLCDKSRVVLRVKGLKNTTDKVIAPHKRVIDDSVSEITSDTGEMYRNWKLGYGWVDTENTKAVYGFAGRAGELELKGMKILSKTDFATIALTTLSDKPISQSDNLLLTTVGRSENKDMKFNATHGLLTDFGSAPSMIEIIDASVKIETDIPGLQVWAINAEGSFYGRIPAVYEDGVLSFNVGNVYPSVYYLIQRA